MKRLPTLAAWVLLASSVAIAQEQAGKIVIYREPNSADSSKIPSVFCDDTELGMIVAGTYLDVTVPAGAHACIADPERLPALTINVDPGNVVYLRLKIEPGPSHHTVLEFVTEADYRRIKLSPASAPLRLRNKTNPPGTERTSQNANVVSVYPKCIRCPDPEYTAALRRARLEGTVTVQLTIQKDGSTSDIQLVESSGHAELDQKAIEAVKYWRFQPARAADGGVLAISSTVKLNFRLSR